MELHEGDRQPPRGPLQAVRYRTGGRQRAHRRPFALDQRLEAVDDCLQLLRGHPYRPDRHRDNFRLLYSAPHPRHPRGQPPRVRRRVGKVPRAARRLCQERHRGGHRRDQRRDEEGAGARAPDSLCRLQAARRRSHVPEQEPDGRPPELPGRQGHGHERRGLPLPGRRARSRPVPGRLRGVPRAQGLRAARRGLLPALGPLPVGGQRNLRAVRAGRGPHHHGDVRGPSLQEVPSRARAVSLLEDKFELGINLWL
mmetsp:Transcript_37206/g.107178  ORF Transcript_37206/g.107178 Transcript_37206/m.107178 type:complete len:254 (+) Transcript_37206:626-1387(+)